MDAPRTGQRHYSLPTYSNVLYLKERGAKSFGSFKITGNTAITNSAGIATFPALKIDKPGGYTAIAVSDVGGSAEATFQINGH